MGYELEKGASDLREPHTRAACERESGCTRVAYSFRGEKSVTMHCCIDLRRNSHYCILRRLPCFTRGW